MVVELYMEYGDFEELCQKQLYDFLLIRAKL